MTLQAVPSNVVRFPVERRQPRRLLNLHELRELFGMSERFWRYELARGMPSHRYGKRLRFDPAEVKRWLEEERDAPKAR